MTDESQPRPLFFDESNRLKARAASVTPQCSQTNNKSPRQLVQGAAPAFLERAEGCRVWDVDGNEYVDCHMSLGPVILGHNYPPVVEAVQRQLEDGPLFSLPHHLEVEVAEQFAETIPYADMVRFAKNGNDVLTMAVRLARAFTDRDVIATHGYHGWQDWSVVDTPGAAGGVPDDVAALTESFEYNDVESLEAIFERHPDDVAAIVMTPVDVEPPEDDFLERVRAIADREDAVLVFDEIITGFRFGRSGAGGHFGVEPDVGCFAKAMANGFPIAALAGRRELLKLIESDDVFISTTYGGETISLAAAKATLEVQAEHDVAGHIWEHGKRLRDGMNDLAEEYGLPEQIDCRGLPPMTRVEFDDAATASGREIHSLFMQEAIRQGVLFKGTHLISFAHTIEDINEILSAYEHAMAVVAEAIESGTVDERLDGALINAPLQFPDR